MNNAIFIDRLVILGVGLIGGSLARAARTVCKEIVGWGIRTATLDRALALGVIDRASIDLATAVRDADFVVLATPPGTIEALARNLSGVLAPKSILTDVVSTKGSVVAAVRTAFGKIPPRFVPGHPIAGTEKSGVDASDAGLFRQRRCILTPLDETDPDAVAKVRALWELCGATVTEMTVEHHDALLAATSHLPHVLAFALVEALARLDTSGEIFRYAAGGFRDFTRIASSDPIMWRDICLANPTPILSMLEQYRAELTHIEDIIRARDAEALYKIFHQARTAREYFLKISN